MAPPTGPPFTSPSPQPLPYPALYLYPLNDSFVPKHIALNHGQHVKIGRQTNAKTAPGERNGALSLYPSSFPFFLRMLSSCFDFRGDGWQVSCTPFAGA